MFTWFIYWNINWPLVMWFMRAVSGQYTQILNSTVTCHNLCHTYSYRWTYISTLINNGILQVTGHIFNTSNFNSCKQIQSDFRTALKQPCLWYPTHVFITTIHKYILSFYIPNNVHFPNIHCMLVNSISKC